MSCSKSGDIFLNLSSVKWVWSQDNASLKMAGKHSFYFGHQCCVDSVWFASIAPVKKSKLKRAVFLTEIQDHATHWQVILCCAALLWSCTYGSASDPDYITVWKPVFWASLLWSSGKWINSFPPHVRVRPVYATRPTGTGDLTPFSGRMQRKGSASWWFRSGAGMSKHPYITWRFHRSTLNEWVLTLIFDRISICYETLFRFPLRSCNNVSIHWLSVCLSEGWMELVQQLHFSINQVHSCDRAPLRIPQ